MEYTHLSSTVNIKTVSQDAKHGVFEVDGLYAGYGLTLGNSLRRTLLSSLPGAAVTQLKIKGVPHEFATSEGIKEDMVEVSLNFKAIRFRMHTDEPKILTLKVKGIQVVTAGHIKTDAEVEVINPEVVLATLTAKNAEFDVEIVVERGLGYASVETRTNEKLGIGAIAIDAHFSPVTKVNYVVENMRVGERTDYNRLRLDIETDGTVSPSAALHKAANILKDHFEKVGVVTVEAFEESPKEEGAAPKKKKKK
ncbi:MAG: DNA-directed RNA polymerase subunit alpha [Patescibacteria group bacterium]